MPKFYVTADQIRQAAKVYAVFAHPGLPWEALTVQARRQAKVDARRILIAGMCVE